MMILCCKTFLIHYLINYHKMQERLNTITWKGSCLWGWIWRLSWLSRIPNEEKVQEGGPPPEHTLLDSEIEVVDLLRVSSFHLWNGNEHVATLFRQLLTWPLPNAKFTTHPNSCVLVHLCIHCAILDSCKKALRTQVLAQRPWLWSSQ